MGGAIEFCTLGMFILGKPNTPRYHGQPTDFCMQMISSSTMENHLYMALREARVHMPWLARAWWLAPNTARQSVGS